MMIYLLETYEKMTLAMSQTLTTELEILKRTHRVL